MINQNEVLETIFEYVDMPNDCENCGHLEATDDGYGLNESPTLYDCNGDAESCPKVKEALLNALEAIGVDEHECIFHKKQAM